MRMLGHLFVVNLTVNKTTFLLLGHLTALPSELTFLLAKRCRNIISTSMNQTAFGFSSEMVNYFLGEIHDII
jgi:hypothetical protein